MAKTQKPLTIGVFGPTAEAIMATPEMQVLRERGDTVVGMSKEHHECPIDVIIGDRVLRTVPSMMKITLMAIENMRKGFPKPPPKPKAKKKGVTNAADTSAHTDI